MRWTLFSSFLLLMISPPQLLADEAATSKLDETYVAYLEEGNFKAAYEYIADATDRVSRLHIAYHLMMGSGVEQDECAAVVILEDLYEGRPVMAISALNFIYNSSWKAVAFLEGSAEAAYELGMYYDAVHKTFRAPMLDENGAYFDKKAYTYFRIAKERGFPVGEEILMKFGDLQVDASIYEIRPRKILCPVRQ